MNQTQLIHSAKQRDTQAIITLLNHSLLMRRVEIIEADLAENSLTLKLQSKKVPNQHKLMPFLREELNSLGIENIETVSVHGLTEESTLAAWEESFTLKPDWSIANHVAKIPALTTVTEETEEPNGEEASDNPDSPDTSAESANEESEDSGEESDEDDIPEYISKYAPKYAPETNPSQNALVKSIPLLGALAIGFGWGIMVGIFIGSQQAANISQPSTTNTNQP